MNKVTFTLLILCIWQTHQLTEEQFDQLREVMTARGVQGLNNVELRLDDMFRGLKASRDMKSQENLISVPLKVLYSDLDIKASKKIGPLIKKNPQYFEDHKCQFFSLFLDELKSRDDPLVKLYIESLPTDFSFMPHNFTPEKIQELQDDALIKKVNTLQSDQKRIYKDFYKHAGKIISEEELNWGDMVCVTRTFTVGTQNDKDMRALGPLVDLFNTQEDDNVAWYFHEFTEALVFYMMRDVKKGEQLFITYGRHSNRYFFFVYGFSDLSAPNMELQMDVCLDKDDSLAEQGSLSCNYNDDHNCEEPESLYDQKLRLLGGDENGCVQLDFSNKTQEDEAQTFSSSLDRLRYIDLKSQDTFNYYQTWFQSLYENEGFAYLMPYTVESELNLLSSLQNRFQIKLDSFSTTIEEDLSLIKSDQNSNIIVLRYLTKKLLRDLIGEIEVAKGFFSMSLREIRNFLKQESKTKRTQLQMYLDSIRKIFKIKFLSHINFQVEIKETFCLGWIIQMETKVQYTYKEIVTITDLAKINFDTLSQTICNQIKEKIENLLQPAYKQMKKDLTKLKPVRNLTVLQTANNKISTQIKKLADKLVAYQNYMLTYAFVGEFESAVKDDDCIIEIPDVVKQVEYTTISPDKKVKKRPIIINDEEELKLKRDKKTFKFSKHFSNKHRTATFDQFNQHSYTCPSCYLTYNELYMLIEHAKVNHRLDLAPQYEEASRYPSLAVMDRTKMSYTCATCHDKIPGSFGNFRYHLKKKHDVKIWYRCLDCSDKYETQQHLAAHIFLIHKKKLHTTCFFYKCRVTLKEFYKEEDLYFHLDDTMAYHIQTPDGLEMYRDK